MAQNILYHHPLSMKSQIVRLAFAERGVDYTPVVVDTGFVKEIYRPWFVALNASMSVPVLVADGHVLAGAKAALSYLDAGDSAEWQAVYDRFPSVSLHFGLMPAFCFDAMAWDLDRRIDDLTKLAGANTPHRGAYLRKARTLMERRRRLAIKCNTEEDLRLIDHLVHAFESQLANGPFFNGNAWSVGDAVWTVCLMRLNWMGLGEFLNPERFPRVAAYFADQSRRPAFAAAGLSVAKPRFLLARQFFYSARAALRGLVPTHAVPAPANGNASGRS